MVAILCFALLALVLAASATPSNCSATSVNGYSFGVTAPGATATATASCFSGYSGSATIQCSLNGTSFNTTTFLSTCTRLTCPVDNSGSYGNAYWPSSVWSSTPVSATGCIAGFNNNSGTPTRLCQNNASTVSWSNSVTNPCVSNTCSAQTYQGYSFGTTAGGATASSPCACGYSGSVTLACNLGGIWATTVNTAGCTLLYCPAQTGSSATGAPSFASVLACSAGTGTCPPNWSGTPSQSCLQSGSWSGTIVNTCSIATCAAISGSGSTGAPSYSITNAGVTASGTCPVGWYGNASSTCNQVSTTVNGAWTVNSNNCQPATCAGFTNSTTHTTWPTTNSLSTASGTCIDGYTGSPSRLCGAPAAQGQSNGVWSSQINNPCSLVYVAPTCPVLSDDNNANWPSSNASTTVTGVCVTGYTGTPTRNCSATGLWQTLITQCIQVTCASVTTTNGGTTFPVTASGSTATGVCNSGWQYSNGVAPSLSCPLSSPTSSFNLNNVINPCVQTQCPSITVNSSTFPTAYSNTNAAGVCALGYSGSPTLNCNADGTWGTISNPCIRMSKTRNGSTLNLFGIDLELFCPTQYDYDATWPSTVTAGASYTATCNVGYPGSPQRTCNFNGTWAATVSYPCEQLSCPSITENNAFFPSSLAQNENVTGTCPEAYSGPVYRICDYNGNWQTIQGICSLNFCSAGTYGNATWTSTPAGTVASGVCISGFTGSPNMSCLNNGSWSQNFINPCQPILYPCALSSFGNANWPVTQPGQIANGTCDGKFVGTPTRLCDSLGNWASDVSNPCVFSITPNGGRIQGLTISSLTSSSISLSWECNDVNVTQFLVQISPDAVNFQSVQLVPITTTSVTATALAQDQTYYFLVYAGDNSSFDQVGAQISATTSINPPQNIVPSQVSSASVVISWAAPVDSLASWYLVSIKTEQSQIYTVIANVTTLTYTITGLTPDTEYNILVQAGFNGVAEPIGVSFGVTTLSVCSSLQSGATTGFGSFNETAAGTTAIGFCSAGLTGSPTLYCGADGSWNFNSLSGSCVTISLSSNAGAIAGGIVGGLVGLVLLVLLLWFLRSQYWNKKDVNSSDYTKPMFPMASSKSERSVSQVSDINRSSDISPSRSGTGKSLFLSNPQSDDIYISFNSLKLGAVIGQGNFGLVYQATYTGAQVAVKKSKGIDEKQILEEAIMMKNIPPHPNVLQYFGVSKEKDEIMMIIELCDKGNLAQYLRNANNIVTAQQSRQLCCQIASGMWHVSKYGIIHRDLRAENILLQLRGNELIAKVADFGLARSLNNHDYQNNAGYYRMTEVKEIPVAWTAPEVLSATDRFKYVAESDVWSFGIVIWEIYTHGAKPFDGIGVQGVIGIIREQNRPVSLLPRPESCPDDIFNIMQTCWAFHPQDRPTFEQLSNQLSN